VIAYGRCVGGSSVHFTANYWRFHEIDFLEYSKLGPIAGTGLVDWPITYSDLEPYYTKVESEIGVSGLADSSPFDPQRSKPCGFCWGFGCEVGAKSSTLASIIPLAERTGRCEIRPNSYVHRIEMDATGRVIGALYFDGHRN